MPKNDGKTYEQRFHERYIVDPQTGCWNWVAGKNGKGYGYLWVDGRTVQAYKFSYELVHGPVQKGKELDHVCRNRGCVNPSKEHIEPVTRRENVVVRGHTITAANAAKTSCPRGHKYDVTVSNGGRGCKRCLKIVRQRYYYKHLRTVRRRAREWQRRKRAQGAVR